jgi:hypothetical protein
VFHKVFLFLLQNVQSHKYQTREQFLGDVDLIYQNCEKYNGPGSNYTKTALKMSELCRERLQEVSQSIQTERAKPGEMTRGKSKHSN